MKIVATVSDSEIEAWLAGRPDATPFHRPAWMRAVGAAYGHRVHMLGAQDDKGEMIGFLPLHDIRSRLFGRALVSAGFGVSGGILADDAAIAERLAEAAVALARSSGIPTVELKGGMLPRSREWHEKSDSYAGFLRPLAKDDEAELLAIPRKQRAEVRRSLGFDLAVSTGSGLAERRDHYRVYSESVRNLGTPVFSRRLFAAVLDAFGNDADILTVRHEGQPVASVLSLYHKGVVMPFWGGGTQAARGLRANDLMYYALMGHARQRGCTHFDFGRSKFGTGAFAFKKNWGFEPQALAYAVWTADGAAPRTVNPLDPKYRMQIAVWQRLPLSIANLVGPFVARGLG